MAKASNSNNSNLKEKLDYIGIKLEKTPKFIKDAQPVNFVSSPTMNDNEHKIFKYVPIDEIEILVSPTNRLTDIKEKYNKAKTLAEYMDPKNIDEYATFLNMITTTSIEGIEEIEKKQKLLNKKIPFGVQYDKDYTWQIYYSENTNRYFMLVTTEDYNYDCFFYLLKEQIKFNKSRKKTKSLIFVPINLVGYSTELLTASEIADLENYLWLFTKDWPNIYEVHDKDDDITLQIVGNTSVYQTIKSGYKIVLNSREEALTFYKLLKALFILQTELPFYYKFDTKINEDCELEFYYNLEQIDYNNLSDFIKNEYLKVDSKITNERKNVTSLEEKLQELKQISALRDIEYLNKQKEIAMYLEYKKTFFGKIKLFIKFKNKKTTIIDIKSDKKKEEKEENNENINQKEETTIINNSKEYYTIEDLVTLYNKLEKELTYIKNMNSDIKALELKIKNMDKKIENATKYIAEIENHKKSIFEFWKFVNKDEMLAVEEGNIQLTDDVSNNLKKVFEYTNDLQDLGIQMDTEQRKSILKDAQDSLFLANSPDVLTCINNVKSNIEIDFDLLRETLKKLKKISESKKKLYKLEDFDIFGSISDNTNKVKTLANKKHRENEKDVLKILNIGKNTDVEEFKDRIEKAEKLIEESIGKIKSPYDMSIYVIEPVKEAIDKTGYSIYNIIPENAINNADISNSEKYNLYKLNIKENMPIVFYTNILYYNNFNETLPVGMDVTDKVIINGSNFNFIPKNMLTFNITKNFEENEIIDKPNVKNIILCEYDLELINDHVDDNKFEGKEEKSDK